jgi:Ca2+-binding RTX toxin-like protein
MTFIRKISFLILFFSNYAFAENIDGIVFYDNKILNARIVEQVRVIKKNINNSIEEAGIENKKLSIINNIPINESAENIDDTDDIVLFKAQVGGGKVDGNIIKPSKSVEHYMNLLGADFYIYIAKNNDPENKSSKFKDGNGRANIVKLDSNNNIKNTNQMKGIVITIDGVENDNTIIPHEMGHLFGGAESKFNKDQPEVSGAFSYAKGHGEEQTSQYSGFSTLLTYVDLYYCSDSGCELDRPVREMVYSNPNNETCGPQENKKCGVPIGEKSEADMSASIGVIAPKLTQIKSRDKELKVISDKTNLNNVTSDGPDKVTGTPINDSINLLAGDDFYIMSKGVDAAFLGSGEDTIMFKYFGDGFVNETYIKDFSREDLILMPEKLGNNYVYSINEEANEIIFFKKDGGKEALILEANFNTNKTDIRNTEIEMGFLYSFQGKDIGTNETLLSRVNRDSQTYENKNYIQARFDQNGYDKTKYDGEIYLQNDRHIIETGSGDDYLYGSDYEKTIIKSNGGDDYLIAGSGLHGNEFYGGSGDDYLLGGDGDDLLLGDYGSDYLSGDKGNDIIGGYQDYNESWELNINSSEWFGIDVCSVDFCGNLYDSGEDNDVIYGSRWGDIYYYELGDGVDYIREYTKFLDDEENKIDLIILDIPQTNNEVSFSRNEYDVLVLLNNEKVLVLENYLKGKEYEIEFILFDDILFSSHEIKSKALTVYGTDDSDEIQGLPELDDVIYGKYGDDFIFTFSGDDTIYGSSGNDIINGGLGSNTIKSGSDNDAVFSRGSDNVYLGTGNDIYYNSIEQQSILHVYENEGTETIHTCSFSENSIATDCSYNFNDSVTQKIIINYNRDESIENYYKNNNDLILEIGSKNKFIFKDAFAEDRIQYDITYQDGSSMDWSQLKTLADIPEENRNVLKDGDYFEIFDESDNGTYYVPEGVMVTFGEYRSGEIVNNGTIVTETIKYDLNMSGNGLLEIKNTSGMRNVSFNDGDILLSGYYSGGSNVSAKTIIIDYIHKHPNGINYQYIYGSLTGDVIVKNSLNDSNYSVLGGLVIKGSLTIDLNVILTTSKYSYYSKSQGLKIYGKIINNGEFNNVDRIGDLSRRSLSLSFYDYFVNGELVQKAYFSPNAFEKIKGNLSIYSTNIYDYNLSNLAILKVFENNSDSLIIDKDYTLGSYSGYNQSIVVKSGSTLRVKSYVAGDFTIESGAKVIIDSFGPYSRDLNISGNGIIEIKNSQGLDNINFVNGTILFSGYNAGSRYSVTAKNIEFNKLYDEQDFQYIRSRVLNGNVIIRNSQFNDYVYFGYQNFKVNGVLKIENDVLFSIGRSDYQNLEVNGLLNNNGLITDKILVRGDYSGRITIKLNDNSEKGINANLNELGNYDISGDIWLNGVKVEDL